MILRKERDYMGTGAFLAVVRVCTGCSEQAVGNFLVVLNRLSMSEGMLFCGKDMDRAFEAHERSPQR